MVFHMTNDLFIVVFAFNYFFDLCFTPYIYLPSTTMLSDLSTQDWGTGLGAVVILTEHDFAKPSFWPISKSYV